MQKRNVIKHFGIVVVLSVAVAVGLNNLLMLINLAQYSKRYQEAAEILYSPSIAEQILYSGILAPILEEVLFRGLLFRVLRKWISFAWAMLISALAFGFYHGNLVQFVYAGVCGLLFAYLYEKLGSVLFPIIAHMVMNIVSLVLTHMEIFAWMMGSVAKALLATGVCIAIAATMFCALQKLDVTKVLKIYCKDKSDVI